MQNYNSRRVTITHKPTGISATCDAWPSFAKNKAMAMRLLRARIYNAKHQPTPTATEVVRKFDVEHDDVKDVRTGRRHGPITPILDGSLGPLVGDTIRSGRPSR